MNKTGLWREHVGDSGIFGKHHIKICFGELRACKCLGRDLNPLRERGRLYEEEREDRDLLGYPFWANGGI